ncbi:MAG TPA: hypothetical protein VFC19_30385 [Candidatus Limnocylindrales bacterium]|nr:hypothetical protein [Candidatus Limnocylindrales bacterium]
MRVYRTMTEQQAGNVVRAYATAIATVVGVDARRTETLVTPMACENEFGQLAEDGRFYVQGTWQMPLPPGEQAAALARLHDGWAAQGFEIKQFEMFSETEGVVIAENPVDEVEVMVESGRPPIAVAVMVMTPCYQPT